MKVGGGGGGGGVVSVMRGGRDGGTGTVYLSVCPPPV